MTEYILAHVWGPWARETPYRSLGYGRETTLGRVIREGPGAGQTTTREEPENPVAEEMEAKIVQLTKRQQRVIRMLYVSRYRMVEVAKRLRTSRAAVTQIHRRALLALR